MLSLASITFLDDRIKILQIKTKFEVELIQILDKVDTLSLTIEEALKKNKVLEIIFAMLV